MRLAKDRLDVGLMTDDRAMLAFMAEEVGLGPPEELRIARGVTQYRFDVDASVVKVNLVEGLSSEARSGYTQIAIARDGIGEPTWLSGPDGVRVGLVPRGHRGVSQLGIHLSVPDLVRAGRYFGETLGWPLEDEGRRARLGASVVLLDPSTEAPEKVEMPVRGWTYLTVQIHDCDAETAAILERGGALAQPAKTLGEVARFSMVGDPWGNQLEISQRASLTGAPLPP